MHYAAKLTTSRLPLPKLAAAVLSSRFPAWIDAASEAVVRASSSSVAVMPRVRDSLVLRLVAKRKPKSHVRRSA